MGRWQDLLFCVDVGRGRGTQRPLGAASQWDPEVRAPPAVYPPATWEDGFHAWGDSHQILAGDQLKRGSLSTSGVGFLIAQRGLGLQQVRRRWQCGRKGGLLVLLQEAAAPHPAPPPGNTAQVHPVLKVLRWSFSFILWAGKSWLV